MKVCVVVVTYNRLFQLKKALECYDTQIKVPEEIIVVNNGSTDGTTSFLDDWAAEKNSIYLRRVINTGENLGGAGGFARGMKEAMKCDNDFVFLADDDAFAEDDTLSVIESFHNSFDNTSSIGAICTSVINCGEFAKGHRRIIKKNMITITENSVPEDWYQKRYFEIDQMTFVGAAINSLIIKEIGFPKEEYFIQYDDIEYSSRIRTAGYKIICIPQSRMHHDTRKENVKFSWKNYYAARNKLSYAMQYFRKCNYLFYKLVFYIKNCSMIALVSGKRTKQQIRMFRVAARDARGNKLGISSVYKPGVDIENL